MLFGLFDFILPPGKMELTLEKLNFARGETIKGHAKLTTQRPIKARGVFVRIYAVEESRGTKGSTSTRTVFDFQQPLEQGEKEYSGGEYDFELVVPGGTGAQMPQLPQEAQMAVAALGMLGGIGMRTSFVKWFVEARLDIPGGRDVSRRVQINVA
jgi:hypothetical protein